MSLIPTTVSSSVVQDVWNSLVYLLKRAHDPLFLATDFTITQLTENLSDIHHNLIQNPFTSDIRIPLPDETARLDYLTQEVETGKLEQLSEITRPVMAQMTAGLGFQKLQNILASAEQNSEKITWSSLSEIKKKLIEAEAYGLLEFVQTQYTLDSVAGHKEVKNHLRAASKALKQGRRDVLPMGYLVCGPVGTGKTFLVTCFSGEVGIPMVKLKNFRSQWQGVTEGNLEKILNLLKAMAHVTVLLDEVH